MTPTRVRKDIERRKRMTQKGKWHMYDRDLTSRFMAARADPAFPYRTLAELVADVDEACTAVKAEIDWTQELLCAQLEAAIVAEKRTFSTAELVALVGREVSELVQEEQYISTYELHTPMDFDLALIAAGFSIR